ncbi:MAG: hypothetical protein WC502_05495 [Methanolinea sp.]
MRVVTGALSGRYGHPLSRPLIASMGALLPPPLLADCSARRHCAPLRSPIAPIGARL